MRSEESVALDYLAKAQYVVVATVGGAEHILDGNPVPGVNG